MPGRYPLERALAAASLSKASPCPLVLTCLPLLPCAPQDIKDFEFDTWMHSAAGAYLSTFIPEADAEAVSALGPLGLLLQAA